MILDVKFGLLTGIAFSALTVILRTQAPSSRVLGQLNQTELYEDVRQGGRKVSASHSSFANWMGVTYAHE